MSLTVEEAEKYRTVLELKRQGWTFEQIAEYVGYADRSSAKRAHDAALKRWGAKAVDDLRSSEGDRLDQLYRRLMGAIADLGVDADPKELATLTNAVVRVSQARRQLFGIDAPKQIEISGQDGAPIVTDVGQLLIERLNQLEQASSG